MRVVSVKTNHTLTRNSLIHSSGEIYRNRTSDASQATLASVSPVFTVVSMCGPFDDSQRVHTYYVNWTDLP